ncbi:transporter, partial [Pseudomonas aeruginosa]|nr:transporter [Pseudomonas aeruginosa]
FTYLWVAANQFLEVDGKGLGWFCLFVSLTACTVAIESFAGASGPFGLWNAVNWTVWALLWFCFFLLLGLSRSIQKPVAYLTLASAIFTAWLPGLLLLGQVLKA